jgi:hypothetical protein
VYILSSSNITTPHPGLLVIPTNTTVSLKMKDKNIETLQKLSKDEEGRETQREIKKSVEKWGRATGYLGIALIISAGTWLSLFLPGQALHQLWQTWGRVLAATSLCIFLPWLYAAGMPLNLWLYGASLRKIVRDFASGKSGKYGG